MATIKSIEEKARAYDIALDKIKRLLGTGSNCSREELEYVFPELAESDDEKIRRELIRFVKGCFPDETSEQRKAYLAWLEKQGNNMGISEATKKKLEDNLNKALEEESSESWNKFLDEQGEQYPIDKYKEWYDFIRLFVKQRTDDYNLIPSRDDIHKWGDDILNHAIKVLEQWSEEDENRFTNLIFLVKCSKENDATKEGFIKFINKLKSFRHQKQWKPSDELIRVIEAIINNRAFQRRHLDSLYEQLKKLREE